MKKLSKAARSNLLNALTILGTIALVIFFGVRGGEIGDAWEALKSADLKWVAAAFAVLSVYLVAEALVLHVFFVQQKVKINFFSTFIVSMIGVFYSNITPAATGGQPMQVFAFKKRGVPSGVASSGLTVKFFCWQMALLILAVSLWAINGATVTPNIESGRWFVYLGFIINGLTVVAVLLLAINRNIVRFIITLLLKIGAALHIVRDLPQASSRADAALSDFRVSVDMVRHHPMQLLVLLMISFAQVLGLMSVVYCVYRALGMSAAPYGELLTLQLLLFVGASFTPLPGASGAQEGGFYLFFQSYFPQGTLLGALLLWRFFTYYLTLLLGMAANIYDNVTGMRRVKREDAQRAADKAQSPSTEEEKE